MTFLTPDATGLNKLPTLASVFEGTREVFVRIGIGMAGVSLITVGLVIMLASDKNVRKLTVDAATVAGTGGAGAVVKMAGKAAVKAAT